MAVSPAPGRHFAASCCWLCAAAAPGIPGQPSAAWTGCYPLPGTVHLVPVEQVIPWTDKYVRAVTENAEHLRSSL